ncbi:hypothetical protein IMG5_184660, partial [Ichthyophthirius multifiliis]
SSFFSSQIFNKIFTSLFFSFSNFQIFSKQNSFNSKHQIFQFFQSFSSKKLQKDITFNAFSLFISEFFNFLKSSSIYDFKRRFSYSKNPFFSKKPSFSFQYLHKLSYIYEFKKLIFSFNKLFSSRNSFQEYPQYFSSKALTLFSQKIIKLSFSIIFFPKEISLLFQISFSVYNQFQILKILSFKSLFMSFIISIFSQNYLIVFSCQIQISFIFCKFSFYLLFSQFYKF